MAEKEKNLVRDLRITDAPDDLHLRIERWMEIHNGRTGEGLNKSDAAIRLLDRATKHIKLPVAV